MGNIYILHFFFSNLAFPHFSTGLSWSPVIESEQKYLVLDNELFIRVFLKGHFVKKNVHPTT